MNNFGDQHIFIFFLAWLGTYLSIPSLLKFASSTGLYVKVNERMSHLKETPNLGGIAIFVGSIIATLFLIPNESFHHLQYLLLCQLVIFFTGLKDDIFILSPSTKIIIQAFCVSMLFFYAGTKIDNFYGILGIYKLSEPVSYLFTLISAIGLINAFNLIDGIDTLASFIGLSILMFLTPWFIYNGFKLESYICLALCGSIIAFFKYNKSPAKIFMGDSGSLYIGLTLTYLVFKFIHLNHNTTDLGYQIASAPIVGFCLFSVPIIDTIRVFAIRLKSKKSPFQADRNHLHHILLAATKSHMKTSITLASINSFGILLCIAALSTFSSRWTCILILSGYYSGVLVLINYIRVKTNNNNQSRSIKTIKGRGPQNEHKRPSVIQ